jgi:FMN phosphatase YigB (HAD superfamily)
MIRRNTMKENIILVDCDGVLCDWEYSFSQWMHHQDIPTMDQSEYDIGKRFHLERGTAKRLVRQFNESAAIAFLPPLRDAVYYMKRLNMLHGYRFHCITSLSSDKYAQRLRYQNLDLLFGRELWDEVICLPCGADKDEALEPYRDSGCFWVEDKVANAELGLTLGLNSILVGHTHNADYKGEAPRFHRWKEIYKHITGEV